MTMRKNEVEKKKPVKISTNGSEIVKDIMKNQRVSMVQLADSVDYNSNQAVYRRLQDDNMKLSTLFRFLKALNYRIVIEPDVGTVGAGKYLVEGTVIEKDSDSE